VVILGSGTATPRLERNASGLAIQAAGLRLLVDIGPGTLRRMCEAGIDSKLVDVILLTHFHPDHVSDLVPFLFAANDTYGPVRQEPFHLVGPAGLEQFYQGLVSVFQDWIAPRGNRLIKRELRLDRPDRLVIAGIQVDSARSPHSSASLSYRIEAGGRSVTISGDTDYSMDLVQLARRTDALICECSMPEGRKVPGHLTPSEAGRIAQAADAGKLVLTHFYPRCDEVDMAAQAAHYYSGVIIKAEDLMAVEI
jgi:ribonuclease BN (tRNA processing enzyme)